MKHPVSIITSPLFMIVILVIINSTVGTIEDDRELDASNFPYGRGVDSEQLQLPRILYLLRQRDVMCHPKRNSEIINSLLGLPKHMNNAGK